MLSVIVAAGGCSAQPSPRSEPHGDTSPTFDDIVSHRNSFLVLFEIPVADGESAALRREQLVICMLASGFEYAPPDSAFASAGRSYPRDLPVFSREWIAKYGYGIAESMYEDPGVSGAPEPIVPDREQFVESNAHGEAYDAALRTCEDEIPSPTAAFDEFAATHARELTDLQARVDSDPRLIQFDGTVERCVQRQGMDYLTLAQAERHFIEQLIRLEDTVVSAGVD